MQEVNENTIVLMTEIDAAELLRLKRGTLTYWRYTNQGPPYIRINKKCVRYRRADLINWLNSKVIQASEN